MTRAALAATLADATALAERQGPGTRIGRGAVPHQSSGDGIFAPAGLALSGVEALSAFRQNAGAYMLSFGNQEAAPAIDHLAAVLEPMLESSGIGFMAACFANPALGRTMYQGHLFQDGRLLVNIPQALIQRLSGRVVVIAHDVVSAGPAAIRARLSAAREQGVALALLDAISVAQTGMIAEAVGPQLLIGGPAWLAGDEAPVAEPASPVGRLAILSGAQDRQTLFQLGAAKQMLAFHQLNLDIANAAEAALSWAQHQDSPLLIAASAPPDRARADIAVTQIMADIAAGLAEAGIRRFVVTGNDTASVVMDRLGAFQLVAGAAAGDLRWLNAGDYNFLLKPGGFGGRNLLADGFEPQIRRNDAAE